MLGSRRPARAPRRVAERCAVGDAGLPPAPTGAVLAWERAVCIRPAAAPRARRGAGGLVVVLSVILKHLKKLFCVFLYLIPNEPTEPQSKVELQFSDTGGAAAADTQKSSASSSGPRPSSWRRDAASSSLPWASNIMPRLLM